MQACAPTGRAVAPRTRGANGPRQASRRTLRRVSIPLPAGPSPQPPSAGPAHQASLIVSELHPRSVLPSPSTAWRCRRIAWSPSSLPTRRSRTSRRRGPGSPSGGRGRLRRASPLRRPQQPRLRPRRPSRRPRPRRRPRLLPLPTNPSAQRWPRASAQVRGEGRRQARQRHPGMAPCVHQHDPTVPARSYLDRRSFHCPGPRILCPHNHARHAGFGNAAPASGGIRTVS